jgi:hypothetical protein
MCSQHNTQHDVNIVTINNRCINQAYNNGRREKRLLAVRAKKSLRQCSLQWSSVCEEKAFLNEVQIENIVVENWLAENFCD